MIDVESCYEQIDKLWTKKRLPDIKALEKRALGETVKNTDEFQRLLTRIEIEVCDKVPNKLPPLLNLISGTNKAVKIAVQVPAAVQQDEEQADPVGEAFEAIMDAWPENEIAQNERFARNAFVEAAKHRPLEDIKKACHKYIEEMTDPAKASTRIIGIKRFVSQEDIFEDWLQKANEVKIVYDTSYFEAAYSWYPNFDGKEDSKVKVDSANFYHRFIKSEDIVDFYCAVQGYAEERRSEIVISRNGTGYDSSLEDKFTKKFVNFIRVWKKQVRYRKLAQLIERPLLKAFRDRGIQYQYVYPDEAFHNSLAWNCSVKEKDEERGAVYAITKVVEDVCNCLTNGNNCCNIRVNTPVDYSIVSEVMVIIKNTASQLKQALPEIPSE